MGFRFHGWQKQPHLKTVEGHLVKTLKFILKNQNFKILGSGRTDAMVSAQEAAFELFLEGEALTDLNEFEGEFNKNLPPDIKALDIQEILDPDFNIIQNAKQKEYVYLFAFGKKSHPFCAPFLTTILEELNLNKMKEAARLFEGSHNFKAFCAKPSGEGNYVRELEKCEIGDNNLISANFFPEKSYALHIQGKGFLRNQVRLIMGALILVGKGELELPDIEKSLLPESNFKMEYIAPASGLILNSLKFEEGLKTPEKAP